MSEISYDSLYKRFFTHPAMVEALLRDFVPASLVGEIDFSTLRRLAHEHVGRDYKKKLNDIIWQVDLRGHPCYIIIMLEFQRKNDHWMAMRLLSYISLLWGNLLAEKRIRAKTGLPPVFPIVIYNGKKPWSAPRDIKSLLPPCPAFLSEFQPALKYFLIDELRIPVKDLSRSDGLASHFFVLQRSDLLDAEDELRRLEKILADPALRELARVFAEWLCHAAYEAGITESVERLDNIEEVNAMLLENARNLKYEYMARYRAAGLEEGLEKGREEGLEKGREEGLEKGLEKGREEGLEKGRAGLRNVLRVLINSKFGEAPDEAGEKLAGINDIDELCGLAEKVPSLESLDKLMSMLDEILARGSRPKS